MTGSFIRFLLLEWFQQHWIDLHTQTQAHKEIWHFCQDLFNKEAEKVARMSCHQKTKTGWCVCVSLLNWSLLLVSESIKRHDSGYTCQIIWETYLDHKKSFSYFTYTQRWVKQWELRQSAKARGTSCSLLWSEKTDHQCTDMDLWTSGTKLLGFYQINVSWNIWFTKTDRHKDLNSLTVNKQLDWLRHLFIDFIFRDAVVGSWLVWVNC